jgi:hypothetical protein
MKSVGRVLFVVAVVAFYGALLFLATLGYRTPSWIDCIVQSLLLALLIYPLVFLKTEPTLSRVAIILFLVTVIGGYVWAILSISD